MTIKATCTWGDGPDVLISNECESPGDLGTLLLKEPIHKDKWVHGICKYTQIDLTAQQARDLAAQLLAAAQACDDMEAELKQYMEEHK